MGVQQGEDGFWDAYDDTGGTIIGSSRDKAGAEQILSTWNAASTTSAPDSEYGTTVGDPVNRTATQTPQNSAQAEINSYNRRMDLQRYIAGGGSDETTINQLQQNISSADSLFSQYLSNDNATGSALGNQSTGLFQKAVSAAGSDGFGTALDQLFQNERNLQSPFTQNSTNTAGNVGNFVVGGQANGDVNFDQWLGNLGDSLAAGSNNQTGNTTTVLPTLNTWNTTDTPTTTVAQNTYTGPTDHRIRLRPKKLDLLNNDVLKPIYHTNGLLFPYTPQISYNQNINYSAMDITHGNQDYQLYKNTGSVEITINGQFTAQNRPEAIYMMSAIHFLRSMSKMYFGEHDENKGLPPPVLLLSGYGNMMFNQVPVIMRNFSINLDQNVDYVRLEFRNGKVNSFAWVPALATITVSLIVQKTPADWRDEFTWEKFANGSLIDRGWV
jgi:hypothetical protein